MGLVSAYPAIVLGMVAGWAVARAGRSLGPTLAVGAIVFAALVWHQSTVPSYATADGESNGAYTTPIWLLFGVVNAGSWALGVAIGAVVARSRRRDPRSG